jgi:hypothetical protein
MAGSAIEVIITSNLNKAAKEWIRVPGKIRTVARNFLPKRERRMLAHAKEVVKVTVYDVYDPTDYERTFRLMDSITVWTGRGGGAESFALIYSNPATAPALHASGGYPKFVAGKGPGIGFLEPVYGGAEAPRPSYFPREFHNAWETASTSIYRNLEADLSRELDDEINLVMM